MLTGMGESGAVGACIGDVKFGFQTTDHSGWVLMNGRSKSTLTVAQQLKCTALGIGTNLPNLSDKQIVGASGSKAVGSTGGNQNIAQNNLPNVTLNGTTNSNGAHTHETRNGSSNKKLVDVSGGGVNSAGFGLNVSFLLSLLNTPTMVTSSAGSHSHGFTTSSINGDVAQQPFISPYLALNCFIYLGT